MPQRKQYSILFLYLLLIAVICFGDHRFTPLNTGMSATTRYAIHLAALVLIAISGLMAWNKKDYPWQRVLWLLAYAIVIGFITLSGVLNYFIPFSESVKEAITMVRVGFANPLPFIVLFVLTAMARKTPYL